jgi:hypothetical protein
MTPPWFTRLGRAADTDPTFDVADKREIARILVDKGDCSDPRMSNPITRDRAN